MNDDCGSILVIDDDEDIRTIVKLLLESTGYRVVTAADGVEAGRELNTGDAPSLILLDLMMPRMDGERFMQTLRASSDGDIPVVIMSGHNVASQKARDLNADGCLTKPVDLDELLATVRRFACRDPTSVASDC
jgi:CheY-like chemotaxis protein